MAIHSIKAVQRIPAPLAQVWDFFSSHANLLTITPGEMKFKIISQNADEKLFTGQIIEYKVSPLLGIPFHWKTLIRNVRPPYYFMDEQLKGPFGIWQHQHMYRAIDGGCEMSDVVLYQIPFGVLGDFANLLLVKRKLKQLFEFRYKKIVSIFGPWPEP